MKTCEHTLVYSKMRRLMLRYKSRIAKCTKIQVSYKYQNKSIYIHVIEDFLHLKPEQITWRTNATFYGICNYNYSDTTCDNACRWTLELFNCFIILNLKAHLFSPRDLNVLQGALLLTLKTIGTDNNKHNKKIKTVKY